MSANYEAFLSRKVPVVPPVGFEPRIGESKLFPHQRAMVEWACRRGRCALFADTGLGKTLMELTWAWEVGKELSRTGAIPHVLILTPLAVAAQMLREAQRFGVPHVRVVRRPDDLDPNGGIAITNYELLHKFDPKLFGGVVLDESSILKAFSGVTKQRLCKAFESTPFRLAGTATPAPNDHLELGNHAEFLGVMSSHQMIARWFINDASSFGTYRLKGHAVRSFWDWVCSWARCVGVPSDLSPAFSDEGYVLPPLDVRTHAVAVDQVADRGESLFREVEMSATSVHREKRRTAPARAKRVAELVSAEPSEPWVIWVETDYDADAVRAVVPEAVEVRGSDSLDVKTERLMAFADGATRILLTKASVAGYGLNWQHCARQAFAGPDYSFEKFYQAVRRSWRFGQVRPVTAHVVLASTELAIWDVVQRKAADHERMKAAMFAASRRSQSKEESTPEYAALKSARLPEWLVSEEARTA